jgi:hypothetical protein
LIVVAISSVGVSVSNSSLAERLAVLNRLNATKSVAVGRKHLLNDIAKLLNLIMQRFYTSAN